jgi:hypothetical protein
MHKRVVLIRVLIAMIVGVLVMAGSVRWLWPRPLPAGESRFMHCDVCGVELVYNARLAGGHCPRCQPPRVGTLIATRDSVGQGAGNPRQKLYITLSIEAVILLGVVVYFLYHPPRAAQIQYGYTKCRNCNRKLRYRADRAGEGAGWCPQCKAVFAYPAELGEAFEQ